MMAGPKDEERDGDAPETTGTRELLDVELGALRKVHGAVLELEGLTNVALRHAAQAERQADRAYALQLDHGHALDRMAKAIAELKGDISAIGRNVQAQGDQVEGAFEGLAQHLQDVKLAALPELAADVRTLRDQVGRLPDETKKGDEGTGLLGWMGMSRRRFTIVTALAAVLGAGGGGALIELVKRLLGGH